MTGVWLNKAVTDAVAEGLSGSVVSHDESLEREFEQRLADCPKLAYRVALGGLHDTTEAEDVAQEQCCAPIAISIACGSATDFARGSCASLFDPQRGIMK